MKREKINYGVIEAWKVTLAYKKRLVMCFKGKLLFSTFQRLQTQLPKAEVVKSSFSFNEATATIRDIKTFHENSAVTLNGWIDKKPKRIGKRLIFGTLRDSNGEYIQVVDNKKLLRNINVEDVVQIEGIVAIKKPSETVVSNESDGGSKIEYEIKIESLNVLNSANEKASQLQDYKKEGNYPPEYRFLQLRLPKYQNYLKTRSKLTNQIRSELSRQNFTEVETPILFKSTPEGAREFLVPSRKTHEVTGEPLFYALPQSPQQYKQLLMASGVHRYYQIARCFRDEDLRADRQPEFTQVDIEMAFANGENVMQIVEKVIKNSWNDCSTSGKLFTVNSNWEIKSLDEVKNVAKISYHDAMTKYGIDKPDLRASKLQILDLTEFNAHSYLNPDFPVFEVLIIRNAFENMKDYKTVWSELSNKNNYAFRSPTVVPIDTEEMENSWYEKMLDTAAFENPKILTRYLNLKKGDIICGCSREPNGSIYENPTPLGRLRQLVLSTERGKKLFQQTENAVAAWVVDFPLFSPQELKLENNPTKQQFPQYLKDTFTSTHHPFTMVKLSDYDKLKDEPAKTLGQHYDFVLNGVELGGGSTRIHVPELQEYIFKNILKIKNSQQLFGHLLNAFQMGTPPHAGFAIGLDRMCAMALGINSIRDVIAFPKTISGTDMVVESPTTVPTEALNLYNIQPKKNL